MFLSGHALACLTSKINSWTGQNLVQKVSSFYGLMCSTILTSACNYRGKPRKTSVTTVGFLAEVWNGYRLNTVLKCHCLKQPAQS